MKKLSFVFAAVAALMLTACGNKQKAAEEATNETESFEEQQIKANMSVQLDSLTNIWVSMENRGVFELDADGKLKVSDEDKKLAPDYLFTPDLLSDKLETMSSKYRAMTVFYIDQQIGKQYDMTDVWTPGLKKLATDLNDPAVKLIQSGEVDIKDPDFGTWQKKLYQAEEDAGRANFFWESCATAIVEQTYLLSVNQDKLLAAITDKDAEDLTYRIALLIDAYEELSEINPDLTQLLTVLQPLGKLNAISVDQLRQQMNESKEQIANSRALLFP